MIPYIIMVVSLLLDGILTNFLPYLPNDLSLFTPSLTLISILVIFPFYRKREEQFFLTVFILGVIYDLFYTNLLFFNGILFLSIGFLMMKIGKNIPQNILNVLLEAIVMVVVYESLTGIILFMFNMVPVTIPKVFYKIVHSLLLNVIYTAILYGILKLIPKKYKEISIN